VQAGLAAKRSDAPTPQLNDAWRRRDCHGGALDRPRVRSRTPGAPPGKAAEARGSTGNRSRTWLRSPAAVDPTTPPARSGCHRSSGYRGHRAAGFSTCVHKATHVLVAMPNHAPRVFGREQLPVRDERYIAEFPEPSFLGALECRNPRQEVVDLRIERPWVVTDAWPERLKLEYSVPQEVRLLPTPDSLIFYCGDEGMSTTVASHGALLIATPTGLCRSQVYPPSSLDVRLRLEPAPRLTVHPVSTDPVDTSRPLAVDLTFRDSKSGAVLTVNGTTTEGAHFVRPFAPEHDTVEVRIRSVPPGACQAQATVQLTARDELLQLPLSPPNAEILIVDAQGRGIAGAVVLQGSLQMAVSSEDGRARFARNATGGDLAFLARGHDIVVLPVAAVTRTHRVVLPPATGVAFDPGAIPTAYLGQLAVVVEGLEVSPVVLQATSIVKRVYGLSLHSADSDAIAFRWPLEVGSNGRHSIAGVYQLARAGRFQVVLTDKFAQEAVRTEVDIVPGAVSDVPVVWNSALREFTGKIVCADSGSTVEGARIAAGDWPVNLDGVRAGPGGTFTFVASAKTTTISAAAPGYVTWFGPMAAESAPLLVRMEPGRNVVVQVLDSKGVRVDAAVRLRHGDREWAGVRRSQGVVEFRGVPRASLIARIAIGDHASEQEVAASLTSATLRAPE
jgi:hypothetical protein